MPPFPASLPTSRASGSAERTDWPAGADSGDEAVCSPETQETVADDRKTPAQRVALTLLRGYQLAFSPMFGGSCRFVPSCSAYAVEAVERFGAVRGSWLALRRLARCRPLSSHGFDPVPGRTSHD